MTVFNHNPLVWERNPDLDPLMTFEEFKFLPHDLGGDRSPFKLVWYIDPRVNPLEEKVWAMSCYRKGSDYTYSKDMGYVMPEINIDINPDINLFTFDVDSCYPPFWDLETYKVYKLDPEYSDRKNQWVVRFSPAYKTVTKWEWAGTISPSFETVINPDLPKFKYNIDHHIELHDMCYEHVWYLDKELSNKKIWAVKITPSAEIKGVKEIGEIVPILLDLDVVFISYNEPNAEENWARVLEKAPHAKRVDGVKGIFEAHKAAANLASTDMFYVVDGDAFLEDSWDFKFQPGIFDRDCTYIWQSRNPINGLVYGYGGVKLFPKNALLKMHQWKSLDLSTTVVPKLKVMDKVSNTTAFNTDPFSTWRSAFREIVKLYNNIKLNPADEDSKSRINIWETVGDNIFGKYSTSGAKAGKQFFESTDDLTKINDRDYLQSLFDKQQKSRYPYIKLVHSNPEHQDWFVVNWCLGNTCNFKCSYCPTDLHNATNPWPELDAIKNFILQVKAAHPEKKIYFEFTGGEVTLYKHFIEVCKFCTEQGVRVGFISNGSRTLRWWEENKQYFDHVCLSFHPEFADEKHFIDVVKILHNDLRTHVNIMMSPDKFDFCYAVANKVKNIGNISMALQPLIHDFGEVLYDYNEFQKKIFEKQHDLIVKHIKYTKSFDYYRGAMQAVAADGTSRIAGAHRFISEKANDWSGWKCYAGVEQLIVDMDGTVRRGWCKVGENIGNIHDEKLMLPTEPVICDKTMCHCNFDIMCTKEL